MYRNCIFCSADLGSNEALEEFPVGRRVAFDAWKGRLWAICTGCLRWNLAPIEERWEAVETAEKRFRDSRLRVHSENIGLAKLADGTRLIRVGEALPSELAAWRYGDQLLRRRRQYFVLGTVGIVGALAQMGAAVAGAAGGFGGLLTVAHWAWERRKRRRPVYRVPAAESPTDGELMLRRRHLAGARVGSHNGELALHLPQGLDSQEVEGPSGRRIWLPSRSLLLTGTSARAVLSRAMVVANQKGASQGHLDAALGLLSEEGGAEGFLWRASRTENALGIDEERLPEGPNFFSHMAATFRGDRIPASALSGWKSRAPRMPATHALALEMALHDESERRALEGELAVLEAAWREAEEIAGIADALPEDPLAGLQRA